MWSPVLDVTYWVTFKLAHIIEMLRGMDLYSAARFAQIIALFGLFSPRPALHSPACTSPGPSSSSAVLVPEDCLFTDLCQRRRTVLFPEHRGAGDSSLAPKDIDIRISIPVALFILCNTKPNYLVLLPVALYILYREYGFKYWPYVAAGTRPGDPTGGVFSLVDEHLVGRSLPAKRTAALRGARAGAPAQRPAGVCHHRHA